jgi:hypothetical protein
MKAESLLATCFMLVYYLVYSSTLNMEATSSSKTSADFQWKSRRYTPQNKTVSLSVLSSAPRHEDIWGSGGIAPRILNPSTR